MKSSPKRLQPSLKLELAYQGPVCGIDEAGRGPLAGAVVAACVYIPEDTRKESFWKQVNDSKKLSGKKRNELFGLIVEHTAYGIAQSSVEEIDQINILQASLLAMTRAFEKMLEDVKFIPLTPTLSPAGRGRSTAGAEGEGDKNPESWVALVDGNQKPRLSCQIQTVVKGDGISLSIAAASILAKVTRDRMMQELCAQYPMYGWGKNAGYGTAQHMAALNEHGPSPHHRQSFAPVKLCLRAS